jgi:hypothetical protein
VWKVIESPDELPSAAEDGPRMRSPSINSNHSTDSDSTGEYGDFPPPSPGCGRANR